MQCKCGASTKPSRAERSKHAAILEFQECSACGRCHFDALRVGGKIVATGAEAQQAFEALEAGQPAQLKPAEPAQVPEPMWRPAAEQPPRDTLVRVEYLTGGHYIGHAGFFDSVWDLIRRWQPHDNREALRQAAIPRYPPGLSMPDWLLPSVDRATKPPIPKVPELRRNDPSLPPVGTNFAFAF